MQDKLLGVSGPMTQIFVLADEAMQQGTPLDPSSIWDWIKEVSASWATPIRLSPLSAAGLHCSAWIQNSQIWPNENSRADGKLFGEPFIIELCKHVGSFSSLTKSEASMKRLSQRQGVSSGRASSTGSRAFENLQDSVSTNHNAPPSCQREVPTVVEGPQVVSRPVLLW